MRKKPTIHDRAVLFADKHAPTAVDQCVTMYAVSAEKIVRDYMILAYVNAYYNGRAALRKELRKAKR